MGEPEKTQRDLHITGLVTLSEKVTFKVLGFFFPLKIYTYSISPIESRELSGFLQFGVN